MKKMALIVLLFSGLMAQENEDYVHLSAGNAQIKATSSAAGISSDVKTDGTQGTLSLGHYYENKARVYASYTYINHDTGVDSSDTFSLGYDFILPVDKKLFSLYAGPVLGYTRYIEPEIDLSGFHYGAQAGALVRIADNIEIDGGYRYLFETGKDDVSVLGHGRFMLERNLLKVKNEKSRKDIFARSIAGT